MVEALAIIIDRRPKERPKKKVDKWVSVPIILSIILLIDRIKINSVIIYINKKGRRKNDKEENSVYQWVIRVGTCHQGLSNSQGII